MTQVPGRMLERTGYFIHTSDNDTHRHELVRGVGAAEVSE